MIMVGDAWFYRQIAVTGYEPPTPDAKPKNTWAFFPVYPLLLKALGGTSDRSFWILSVLVSNVALLGALFAVAAAGRAMGASDDDAERAVWYIALFPTSYFFSLPMTESLFLLLSAATFLAAARQRWPVAGILGALAAATRVIGICLLPALLLLPLQRRQRLSTQQLWLLAIPLSLVAFIAYLYIHTGDPLAFVHAQTLWGRAPGRRFAMAFPQQRPHVSKPWNFVALNAAAAITDDRRRLLVPRAPPVVVRRLHAAVRRRPAQLRLAAIDGALRPRRLPALLLAGRRSDAPHRATAPSPPPSSSSSAGWSRSSPSASTSRWRDLDTPPTRP